MNTTYSDLLVTADLGGMNYPHFRDKEAVKLGSLPKVTSLAGDRNTVKSDNVHT